MGNDKFIGFLRKVFLFIIYASSIVIVLAWLLHISNESHTTVNSLEASILPSGHAPSAERAMIVNGIALGEPVASLNGAYEVWFSINNPIDVEGAYRRGWVVGDNSQIKRETKLFVVFRNTLATKFNSQIDYFVSTSKERLMGER